MIYIFVTLLLLFLLLAFLIWGNADRPKDNSNVPFVSSRDAPVLAHGKRIKVLTYNVQYLAGKNYVFFHDMPDMSGKDTVVKKEDIIFVAKKIAHVIADEDPDFICLQEVDCGSRRTNYIDQVKLLLNNLPAEYNCYVSDYYWKVRFVPHPKLMGSLRVKLVLISKYRINRVVRRNLPDLPVNIFLKPFSGKKMILQAFLPLSDGSELAVMCTHLDAFTVGTDIMTKQLNFLRFRLSALDTHNIPWILAGDFNLLPPDQYEKITESHRSYYNPNTELEDFYGEYNVIPSLEDVIKDQSGQYFTFFGNDPVLQKPDRTLDYIVYSKQLRLLRYHVRHFDTMDLSDHFPVIASFEL